MIGMEDIRRCQAFERVVIKGRAIFPDDPMVNSEGGYCGARITKLVSGETLMATVRR